MMMIWAIFLSFFGSAAAADVTLWHAYRGAERDALESLVEQYNATHSATVLTRAVPYDGFNSKLEAAIPRGNGPDLFIAAHERLGTPKPRRLSP